MNKKITTLLAGSVFAAATLLLQTQAVSAQSLRYQGELPPVAKPAAGPDGNLTVILSPFNKCDFTATEPVSAVITNSGDVDISNFPISFKVGTGTPVTETVTDVIAPGAKKTYTFTATADLSTLTTYTIEVSVAVPSDANTANDKKSVTVTKSTPKNFDTDAIFTGFETTDAVPTGPTGLFDLLDLSDTRVSWDVAEKQVPRSGKQSCALFTLDQPSNDWIFTKNCVPLNAGDKVEISFWYCGNGFGSTLSGVERLAVRVGLGKDPAQMTTTLFVDTTFGGVTYRPGGGTFTAPAAGNYFFALQGYTPARSTTSQGLISIDDLKIRKISAEEVVVTAMKSPKTSCALGDAEPIKLTLSNIGTAPVSNFNVSIKPNKTSSLEVVETYTGTLNPGETKDFTFTQTIDLSAATSYKPVAKTDKSKVGQELYTSVSEVKSKTFNSNGSALENDFEEATDQLGWEVEDANSDSVSWIYFRTPDTSIPQSPVRVLVYFSNGERTADADDYFYSKCMDLKAGQKYECSVSYRVLGGAEDGPSFQLTLGTDQLATAQDRTLLTVEGIENEEYEVAERTGITVPEDGTYYVGIRATSAANTGALYLDDFSFLRNDASVDAIKYTNAAHAVKVFPNPATDAINVQVSLDKAQDAVISVTDILGNVVYKQDRKGLFNETLNIDLSNQAKGLYFVRIQNADLNIVKKVSLTK